jgi:hypothetical protein
LSGLSIRALLAAFLFAGLGGIASFEALFAPSADLWKLWSAHDEKSAERVDHAAWNGLLDKHVAQGADAGWRVFPTGGLQGLSARRWTPISAGLPGHG